MDIEQEFEEEDMRGGRAKRYLLRFIAFLIVVGLIAVVVWIVSLERAASAPLRTSDAFVKSLLARDAKKAYALTGEDFRTHTTEDELAQVAEAASKGLKSDTLKVSKGDIEEVERGKLATVYYEIKGTDTIYNLKIRLLKEKDKGWLVVSADNEAKQ